MVTFCVICIRCNRPHTPESIGPHSISSLSNEGIRQTAQIANLMMSTERVIEYCELEPEKQPTASKAISEDWPTDGRIEFRHAFYRYSETADTVLKDLSFVIKPKEKIGA